VHTQVQSTEFEPCRPKVLAPLKVKVRKAINQLAAGTCSQSLGAIFTRFEVVNFILDLVGYTTDKPLYTLSLLEPSFGGGDFLLSAIERLLQSWWQ